MNRRDLFSGAAVVSVAGIADAEPLYGGARGPGMTPREFAYVGGSHQCGECLHIMLVETPWTHMDQPEANGAGAVTLRCLNADCSRHGVLYRYPTVELERL